jgi:hypothetical protein
MNYAALHLIMVATNKKVLIDPMIFLKLLNPRPKPIGNNNYSGFTSFTKDSTLTLAFVMGGVAGLRYDLAIEYLKEQYAMGSIEVKVVQNQSKSTQPGEFEGRRTTPLKVFAEGFFFDSKGALMGLLYYPLVLS